MWDQASIRKNVFNSTESMWHAGVSNMLPRVVEWDLGYLGMQSNTDMMRCVCVRARVCERGLIMQSLSIDFADDTVYPAIERLHRHILPHGESEKGAGSLEK